MGSSETGVWARVRNITFLKMLQIIDTFPVFQKLFLNLIMFIFLQDISNSGKVGRGAAHKLYDRAFEPAWVLFSIFRSDLFSAPKKGQISAGCRVHI